MSQEEFNEFYEQRSLLFLALIKAMQSSCSFRCRLQRDERSPDGWHIDRYLYFVVGADLGSGQITYYFPISMWELADFLPTRKSVPSMDGYSSQEICDRLRDLLR